MTSPAELSDWLWSIQHDPGGATDDVIARVIALTLGAITAENRAQRCEAAEALTAIARHADETMDAAACRARVAPIMDAVPALFERLLAPTAIGHLAADGISDVIPYVGLDEASSQRALDVLDRTPLGKNTRLLRAICYERTPTARAAAALDRASASDEHVADLIDVARRFAARRSLRARAVTMQHERLELTDPAGVAGFVEQRWEPVTRTYEMVDVLMPSVRWVPTDPPLVPGKGTPFFALATMRQMRRFGIPFAGVECLIVGANYHVESILQLARAERAGIAPERRLFHTRSLASVLTPMTQAGHVYTGVHAARGRRGPLAEVLAWHACRPRARDRTQEHAALLAAFELTPDDEVFYAYETHVALRPYDAAIDASP